MIFDLWKKVKAGLSGASTQNGRARGPDPLEILKRSFREVYLLAEQIQSHADRAPYPHVAARLRQIAAEKRDKAQSLKEKILKLGGALEEPEAEPKSGKNHWERMVRDLEDQKTLEKSLLQRALSLSEQAPEISNFLNDIASAQLPHKEALLDLTARADPQAHQS